MNNEIIKAALLFLRDNLRKAERDGYLQAADCEEITVQDIQEQIDELG